MSKVKKVLPQKFMKIYVGNGHFHDCYIVGIEIIRSKSKIIPFVDLKVSIFNGEQKYEIHYTSVNRLCINGNFSNENCMWVSHKDGIIDSWGYDEFDLSEDNLIVHEILFLSGTMVKVVCGNICIKVIR